MVLPKETKEAELGSANDRGKWEKKENVLDPGPVTCTH